MKKFAKRFTLAFLAGILMALGAVLGACGGKDPEPSEEQGLYYYDAGTEEYTLELILGNTFTLEMKGKEMTGKYELDGELLTLKVKKGDELSANYYENAVTLTYEEATYRFLKKIDYTVTFQTNGGTAVDAQKVVNGKTVAKPDDPSKTDAATQEDLVFIGWYTDNGTFKNPYLFSQPVTGDLTLYARFVANIHPEFTVKFDAGEGVEAIPDETTVAHKLFAEQLPTPQKKGAEFLGWYVSQSYSKNELSYLYTAEQVLAESTTLYAVWDDGSPVVSVNSAGVEVKLATLGQRYYITILGPDGGVLVNNVTNTGATYPYNFASGAAGKYTITVTIGEKTTTRYFVNKTLARVSVFEVEGDVVLFNAVENAAKYLLSVECGTVGHDHSEIDLGTERSWSFADCDMPENGFVFTVTAVGANGYVNSVSEAFRYKRELKSVTGIKAESAKEQIKWNAVEEATSYVVTIKKGEETVFAQNVGNTTSIDLKYYPKGEYTILVQPVARGWNSPAATSYTYQKTRLGTPKDLTYAENSLEWEASEGAEKYIVTADGEEHICEGTSVSLDELNLNGAIENHKISVRARAQGADDSLESGVITLRTTTLGELTYRGGVLSWDPIIGIDTYEVTVGSDAPVEVTDSSYNVVFHQAGEVTITVKVKDGSISDTKHITVTVYELALQMDREGANPLASLYLADGDPVNPATPEFPGYTFTHWYTGPASVSGRTEFPTNSQFDHTGNVNTLYAGWEANIYTVTFNLGRYGDTSQTLKAVKVRFGDMADIDGNPLPIALSLDTNRVFSGWHFNNDMGIQLTDAKGVFTTKYLQPSDMTLYASYAELFLFTTTTNDNGAKEVSVSAGPAIKQGIVTEARIPERYEGAPIVRVLDFTSCGKLESIDIPGTVTLMVVSGSGNVFDKCTALKAVNIYDVTGVEKVFFSDDGVLYYENSVLGVKELRFFPVAKAGSYEIPAGVEVIQSGAFVNTDKLTSLTISKDVITIETGAFNGCDGLTDLIFESGGTLELTIREGAFDGCDALSSINLPARLKEFDKTTFRNFEGLTTIEVEAGSTFSAIDGLLVQQYGENGGQYEIVFAPRGREFGDYKITDSSIVSIGEEAFYEHKKLTGITIPAWIRNIGTNAFGHLAGTSTSGFGKIVFEGQKGDPDLTIQEKAFYAGYLTTSKIDSGTNSRVDALRLPANLVSLGAYAFGRYSKITEVYVDVDTGDTGKEIDFEENAFCSESGSLMYVTTVHIGAGCPAFSYSGVFGTKLTTVEIDHDNPYVKEENSVVYNIGLTDILFYPNEKEGAYIVPDTVLAIRSSTFANRKGLTEITIPASVTSVGENAFNGCTALKKVTFLEPEGGETAEDLTIEARAFYGCTQLSDIELPDRLVHLGLNCFYNCDGLESIHFPKNLARIDAVAETSSTPAHWDIFQGCNNLKNVTVDEANENYTAIDGVIYGLEEFKIVKDGTKVVEKVPYEAFYCSPGAEGTVTVPGTVRNIATYAFRDINHVEKIVFAPLVDLYDAKSEEDALIDIELTFQKYAFYGFNTDSATYGSYNQSVKEVVFPQGIKEMGDYLLYSFKGITKLTIPNTVTSIHPKAFYGCYALADVTFEEGGEEPLVLEDGLSEGGGSEGSNIYGVFADYWSGMSTTPSVNRFEHIKTIHFPKRLQRLGKNTFYYSKVEEVTFAPGTENLEIGNSAFYRCSNLDPDFVIPEGTISIGESVFSYVSLNKIELPSTLKTLADYAFSSVKLLQPQETFIVPANVVSIGSYIFSSIPTVKFKTIDFSKATKLASIGNYAFSGQNQLTSVKFAPQSANPVPLTIGNSAFATATALESITIPAYVTSLGNYVFQNDSALRTVTFDTYTEGDKQGKSDLASIGQQAFSKSGVTKIVFPESTAEELTLGDKLFSFCTKITEVTVPNSVHDINNVFTGCGSLKTITIAEGSDYFSNKGDLPVLYDAQGNSVLYVFAEVKGDFGTIGGTTIGEGAFNGQASITKLTIASTVQEIGASAFANCINLEEVVFEQGSALTKIGANAFENCFKLRSINLQICTNLTAIPGYLFKNCPSLKEITLPSSVTSLAAYALSYVGAETIDLSACTGLTDLANYTFGYDRQLTDIKLPASIEFLGQNTFRYCDSLTELDLSMTKVVHISNTKGSAQAEASSPASLGVFGSENLETVRLPATIKSIGNGTFSGANSLKYVYIGNLEANDFTTVEKFLYGAFAHSGITSAKIAGTSTFITKVRNSATTTTSLKGTFSGCANLTKVEIVSPENLTSIPDDMFGGCASLSEFNFTSLINLTSIGKFAFLGCGFESIDLSKCVGGSSFLGAEGAFQNCTQLSSVKLPATVGTMGNKVFMNTGFVNIDLKDFAGVTKFGTYAFADCIALETVHFPAKVPTLNTYMFNGCTELDTVTFEEGFKAEFQNYMFGSCSSLEHIDLSNVDITKFGTYTFNKCVSLQEIDLSNCSAVALGNYMFDGCENLTSVKLSNKLNYIGTYSFRNCISLETLDLSQTQLKIISTSATTNVTYSTAAHTFENCTSLHTLKLPEGITQIAGQVFLNCTSLKTIENLDFANLTAIGKEAFRNSGITGTVTLGSGLTVLGEYAFVGCEGIAAFTGSASGVHMASTTDAFDIAGESNGLLTATNTADGVKTVVGLPKDVGVTDDTLSLTGDFTLGAYIFDGFTLTGVTKLDLSGLTATAIPNYAFANSSFTEIVLPDTITTIGTYAFDGAANLTTVNLPQGLLSIGNYAFRDCVSLADVTLPEGIETLGTYLFQNCTSLTKINIPASLKAIPNYAFAGTSLTDLKIPETLESIGMYAYQSTKLGDVVIPATLTKLGEYAFQLSTIKSVTFEGSTIEPVDTNGAPYTIAYWFDQCAELKDVDFGPRTVIYSREFQKSGIEEITIPATIQSFSGGYVFWECQNLTTVTFKSNPIDGSSSVPSYLFKDCTALTTVELPEDLVTIGSSMFENCPMLTNITIPETVTTINGSAFKGCTSLKGDIVLSDNVISISGNAFADCTGIDSIELSAGVGNIVNTVFANWTADQEVRFRNSAFEVCASCGVAWLVDFLPTVVYNYGA